VTRGVAVCTTARFFCFLAEYCAARGVAFADGNALVEFPPEFAG
jgi:hypothetical protein